jgi:hypothetical protein
MADQQVAPADSISIPTPWGAPLIARGSLVIIVLLMLADMAFTAYVNNERRLEHISLEGQISYQSCLIRLNLYVLKQGGSVDMQKVPTELWSCIPKFAYDPGPLDRGR